MDTHRRRGSIRIALGNGVHDGLMLLAVTGGEFRDAKPTISYLPFALPGRMPPYAGEVVQQPQKDRISRHLGNPPMKGRIELLAFGTGFGALSAPDKIGQIGQFRCGRQSCSLRRHRRFDGQSCLHQLQWGGAACKNILVDGMTQWACPEECALSDMAPDLARFLHLDQSAAKRFPTASQPAGKVAFRSQPITGRHPFAVEVFAQYGQHPCRSSRYHGITSLQTNLQTNPRPCNMVYF